MTQDETLVRAAQARAAISGYLAQNPGPHPARDVAEALGMLPRVAGQYMRHMSNEKLVIMRKQEGENVYSLKEGDNDLVMGEAKAKKSHKAIPKSKNGKEVELSINGTLIVVGRNPTSGRIRITLEEA
jgi:hypothetical protein